MNDHAVSFFVEGEKPRTKGSTDSFFDKRTKKLRTVSSNKRGKAWERVIATEAIAAGVRLIEGPVEMEMVFYFARPQCHYDPRGTLLHDAPRWPITQNLGDIDKLERACLDALTRVAYANDSQVVRVNKKEKRWARADAHESAGAYISVGPIDPPVTP